MKNSTFIAFLLCICIGLSVSAQPVKKERLNRKTQKSTLSLKKKKSKSTKAVNEISLFEDFSKFTAGTEAEPDFSDITNPDTGEILPQYTLTPGWYSIAVYQAGGCAYIGAYMFEEEIFGGELITPDLDLSANSGKYTVKFRAKSESETGDILNVYWVDESEDEYPYEEVEITGEWKEYTVELTNGSELIYFSFFSDYENCFIDDVQIIQDGGGTSGLEAPIVQAPTNESANSFTANWSAVDGATEYLLDVYTKTGTEIKTVLSENFDGLTNGSPNGSTGTKDISAELDSYMQQAGWTGEKIYEAGGTAKMGSSGSLGSITTPSMDLSENGGAFTLSFDAMAWSKDSTELKIYLDGALVHTQSGLNNTEFYTMKPFSVDLTGGTTSSKIKFEGKQERRGRFFLDNVLVTQGGAVLTPVTGSPFTTAETSYDVTGLESLTTYYYRVTAKNDEGVSPKSVEQSAQTTTGNSIELDKYNFKVYVDKGDLHVIADTAEKIEVYTISGTLLTSVNGTIGDNVLSLPYSGVYIVKVGKSTVKIVK